MRVMSPLFWCSTIFRRSLWRCFEVEVGGSPGQRRCFTGQGLAVCRQRLGLLQLRDGPAEKRFRFLGKRWVEILLRKPSAILWNVD